MQKRTLTPIDAKELLGYDKLGELPEATGTDKLVLKRGNLFAVCGRLGDIWPPGARDMGGYFEDTRFLSKLKLNIAGGPPVVLSTHTSAEYTSQVDMTVTSTHFGGVFQDPVNFLHLRREQLIDEHYVERLTLTNYLVRNIDYWVEYEFASDFADQFEVRGATREGRGTYFAPLIDGGRVVWVYQGRDGVLYRCDLSFEGRTPDQLSSSRARFEFHLGPNEGASLEVHAAPSLHAVRSGASVREAADAARSPKYKPPPLATELPEENWQYPGSEPVTQPPAQHRFDERLSRARGAYRAWAASTARIHSNEDVFDEALQGAISDLHALGIVWDGRRVISAGVPWYASPFGRDSLITGFQSLLVTPEIAREALIFLAAHQGKKVDDFREEEPGKILHEIRRGELARTGEVPHTPYYGGVDSTALFLILYTEYLKWTDDRATGDQLLPAAELALRWIDEYGDKDGDGFVEYKRKTERGLRNQGWKDSWDGVPHLDGTPAEPPIALVEVQGYCIDARNRMARLFESLGRHDDAARCAAAAEKMQKRLDEVFWMEEAGTYAIALDGEKKLVQSVTSNAGHLLFSHAISDARAQRVARQLMSPASFSGYGIRTLSKGQRPYNPLSYHDGTIWPHDNSLVAMGFSNYGMQKEAAQVLRANFDACRQFRQYRLPELFCGMQRTEGDLVVSYPVSCSPQAWASGAFFLLLRAALGIFPDARRRLLRIVNPELPEPLESLTIEGMLVGQTRLTLHFHRNGEGTFAAVKEMEGQPIAIRVDVGAHHEVTD
jgi:glycogen debranching enzyme